MSLHGWLILALLVATTSCTQAPLTKQGHEFSLHTAQDSTFISFRDFLLRVQNATFDEFNGTKVDCIRDFQDMKIHVLRMYSGITNTTNITSFLFGNNTVDCIPLYEQPAIHRFNISKIPSPPKISEPNKTSPGTRPGNFSYVDSPLRLNLSDKFGHPISCPDDTIPMYRLTLERLTSYHTLADFFSKVPSSLGPPSLNLSEPKFNPDWEGTHLHAYAQQYVDNYGGESFLNLWSPVGDFSLSQHWYSTGTGDSTQTLEGGWQVYPDNWGWKTAVLFIYYTADNYGKSKCYNTDCGGFVGTNKHWLFGAPFSAYSTMGGDQYGFGLQWKLYNGNWWLFLRGDFGMEAVGHYPASIYNGGEMSRKSTLIQYGGEVARKSGDVWPQMGSGKFASAGFGQAAYQHTIFYTARDQNNGVGTWANLSPVDEAQESCFTVDVTEATSGGSWGTYFYFGGSGGNVCN